MNKNKIPFKIKIRHFYVQTFIRGLVSQIYFSLFCYGMYLYECVCLVEDNSEVQKIVQNSLKLKLLVFLSHSLWMRSELSPSDSILCHLLTIYLSCLMNFDFNIIPYLQEVYLIPLKTICVRRLKSHSFKL